MNDVYPVLLIILPVAAGIAFFFWFWLDLLIDSVGAKHYRWAAANFALPPVVLVYFFRYMRDYLTKGRILALGGSLMAFAYLAFCFNPYRAIHIYP